MLMLCMFATLGLAEGTQDACTERNRVKWEKHNERVLSEIKSDFNLNLDGYEEIPFWEHMKKLRLEKTREEALTFGNLFRGASIGARRLFVKTQDNTITGYLLYKQINGTNVVQKIVREKDVWKVVKTKKKKAERYYANFERCNNTP